MQERDTFPLCPDARGLVDQTNAGGAAAVEHVIQIVDGEAEVMDARSFSGNELVDGTVGRLAFKELDQGIAGRQARDSGAIRVIEGNVGKAEDVAVEGK